MRADIHIKLLFSKQQQGSTLYAYVICNDKNFTEISEYQNTAKSNYNQLIFIKPRVTDQLFFSW